MQDFELVCCHTYFITYLSFFVSNGYITNFGYADNTTP